MFLYGVIAVKKVAGYVSLMNFKRITIDLSLEDFMNRTYNDDIFKLLETLLNDHVDLFRRQMLQNVTKMRIPLIPPLDSDSFRHPVPIQSARVFRLIPPPLVGA